MLRETGTAFAVLALYVLMLLLPLHQAAGMQRDFNALGFSTLDSWSVCQQLAVDDDGDPKEAAALNCPAIGVGKNGLDASLPPLPVFAAPPLVAGTALVEPQQPFSSRPIAHVGQSRAPPEIT